MENKRNTTEWSEDIRKGYKTVSIEFNVPGTSVANFIKKFKVHGTVANISCCGHKRKIGPRLSKRIA